jgi:hypothetical protein
MDNFADISAAGYGQAHQAAMQAQDYQRKWSGFDTMAVQANNPLMALGAQFGEAGTAAASIMQMVAMGNPQLSGFMSRLAMPPGTDLAAAARFRSVQMTAGRMGMSGITDAYAGLIPGLSPSSSGYQALNMGIMAIDQATGGMMTRGAFMLNENLLTMQGAGSIVEAAQWQNVVGNLDPHRAGMLQLSLMNRSRADESGRVFNAADNFGNEGNFRLRNQRFTAGFNNDELAQAALFAERNGIYDEQGVSALRQTPGVDRQIKAQIARLRGLASPDEVTLTGEDRESYFRSEGIVGAAGLSARAARRLQQSLMPNAKLPELFGIMEREGMTPRNEKELGGLEQVVTQLQALGRAAAMSTEAMIKGAQGMQQQFGGSLLYNATVLASSQSMDRMFRMESGNGTGFSVDANLSELSSGQVAQRMASLSGSQHQARIAVLERSGRLGEYSKFLAAGDPAGAAAFIAGLGNTDPGLAASARALMRDRASMDIYSRRAEQRMDAAGISRDDQYSGSLMAVRAEFMRELGRTGPIDFGGTRLTGTQARERYLAMPEALKSLLSQGMAGDLAPAQMAELNAGLMSSMGVNFAGLMQGAGGASSAGAALYNLMQTDTTVRSNFKSKEETAAFAALQRVTSKVGDLAMVRGGAAMIVSDLLNPGTDVLGRYLTDGAAGIGRLAERSGMVYAAQTADMVKALNGMTPAALAEAGSAILEYDAAVGTYQNKVRSSGENSPASKSARERALAAAATVQQKLGTNIDTDPLKPANERTGSIAEQNISAVKALTTGIEKLTGLLGQITGAPMADGTPKAGGQTGVDPLQALKSLVHIKIEQLHPDAKVTVGSSDTANAPDASSIPMANSAPRAQRFTRTY